MMRQIVMASAIALAAPALAQDMIVDKPLPPAANPAAPTTPAQTPLVATDESDDQSPDMAVETGLTADASVTDATATADTAVTGTDAASVDATTTMHSSARTMDTAVGMGGPLEAATEYPVCSRTITDSCLQRPNSPKPR